MKKILQITCETILCGAAGALLGILATFFINDLLVTYIAATGGAVVGLIGYYVLYQYTENVTHHLKVYTKHCVTAVIVAAVTLATALMVYSHHQDHRKALVAQAVAQQVAPQCETTNTYEIKNISYSNGSYTVYVPNTQRNTLKKIVLDQEYTLKEVPNSSTSYYSFEQPGISTPDGTRPLKAINSALLHKQTCFWVDGPDRIGEHTVYHVTF